MNYQSKSKAVLVYSFMFIAARFRLPRSKTTNFFPVLSVNQKSQLFLLLRVWKRYIQGMIGGRPTKAYSMLGEWDLNIMHVSPQPKDHSTKSAKNTSIKT